MFPLFRLLRLWSDYPATIKRLSTINASDFLATIDFGNYQRLWRLWQLSVGWRRSVPGLGLVRRWSCPAALHLGRFFWVRSRRFTLGRAAAGRSDGVQWRFLPFLGRSVGVLMSGYIVNRVSRSVRCAPCVRQIRGIRFYLTVPELSQIVRVALYSPQDVRK